MLEAAQPGTILEPNMKQLPGRQRRFRDSDVGSVQLHLGNAQISYSCYVTLGNPVYCTCSGSEIGWKLGNGRQAKNTLFGACMQEIRLPMVECASFLHV